MVLIVSSWLTALMVVAAPSKKTPDGGTAVKATTLKNPILVDGDKFALNLKTRQGVYTGNVKVLRGPTRIRCKRLVAYYTEAQEISKVECLGDVEVFDGDRWAKGDRADFDNERGILEVTGSPEARQGPNRMRGRKFIFDVNNNLLSVEGKVETVFESSGKGLPAPAATKTPEKGAR